MIRRKAGHRQAIQEREEQRIAKLHATLGDRDDLRVTRSVIIDGDRQAEPRERAGRADVEQCTSRGDGTAHPDDRAHGAERRQEWQRDEEGKRRIHLVNTRGDVVAELVREEDGQERCRELGAVHQRGPRQERGVQRLHEGRALACVHGLVAKRGRGKHAHDGQQEEDEVSPPRLRLGQLG